MKSFFTFTRWDALFILLVMLTCIMVDVLDNHHVIRACLLGIAMGLSYGLGLFDALRHLKQRVREEISKLYEEVAKHFPSIH